MSRRHGGRAPKSPNARGRLAIALALAVGSGPAVLIPIASAIRYESVTSDAFLLVNSLSVLICAVIGNSYETVLVASASRGKSAGAVVPAKSTVFLALRGAIYTALISPVAYAIVATFYALSTSESARTETIETLAYAAVPIILQSATWAAAAILGALTIVTARLPTYYVSNAFRTTFALLAIVIGLPPLAVCWALAIGEALRLVFLAFMLRRRKVVQRAAASPWMVHAPKVREMLHQMGSMLISQFVPVVARFAFLSAGPGFLTLSEFANRLYSAGSQVGMSLVVMPHVTKMSMYFGSDQKHSRRAVADKAARRVLRDSSVLALVGVVGSLCVWGALILWRPELAMGGLWGAFLYLALPLAALNAWSSRVIVQAQKSSRLPLLASLHLVSTAAIVAVSIALQVPFVGIVAMVVSQYAVGIAAHVLALRYAEQAR